MVRVQFVYPLRRFSRLTSLFSGSTNLPELRVECGSVKESGIFGDCMVEPTKRTVGLWESPDPSPTSNRSFICFLSVKIILKIGPHCRCQ